MALLEKHLVIKQSIVPKSGKGLFTKVDIPAGTLIVEYKGKLVSWKSVEAEDGINNYIFQINSRWAVDAEKAMKTHGRYANDARGHTRIKGVRNNSQYIVEGRKVFIQATRKIYAGGEIFVDYGRAYWNLDKKQREEEAALAKAAKRKKNKKSKKTK